MNIKVEESLGAMVAYGSSDIKILKSVYDLVPEDLREDFETVLVESGNKYHQIVNDTKLRGERPNAQAIKKQSMQIVSSWLIKKGVQVDKTRVVKTKNPRIPSNDEKISVTPKKNYFVEVDSTLEDIDRMFSNFDSESLSDEHIQAEESQELSSIDLDDELFDGLDILSGLDDF